jgi:hypothetical protein
MNKYTISFLALAVTMIFSLACTTIKYVPVETVKEIAVHDTTYLHRTDTLVQVPEVSLSDYINVTDTLRLEAPYALSTAWVDTTLGILKGRLVQGGKLPVQVVEKERVVTKDSLVYQDRPVPVEVEKVVKKVPLLYKIFAWIGFAALLLLAGSLVWRFAKT